MKKKCKMCKKNLKITNFYKNKSTSDNYQHMCKPCMYKVYTIKKYNIDKDEYEILIKKQDYKCGICGMNKNLVIDHDHATGDIRGFRLNLYSS